jgi:hypothetical protein
VYCQPSRRSLPVLSLWRGVGGLPSGECIARRLSCMLIKFLHQSVSYQVQACSALFALQMRVTCASVQPSATAEHPRLQAPTLTSTNNGASSLAPLPTPSMVALVLLEGRTRACQWNSSAHFQAEKSCAQHAAWQECSAVELTDLGRTGQHGLRHKWHREQTCSYLEKLMRLSALMIGTVDEDRSVIPDHFHSHQKHDRRGTFLSFDPMHACLRNQ